VQAYIFFKVKSHKNCKSENIVPEVVSVVDHYLQLVIFKLGDATAFKERLKKTEKPVQNG